MFKFLSLEDMRNALQIKKSHFQEGIPWFGKIQNLVTVEAGWFLMILQKFKSYQVIATNSVQDSWKYHHLKILAIQMNFWLILLDGTTRKQTIILSQLNFQTDLNQLLHSLPKPEEVNNICYIMHGLLSIPMYNVLIKWFHKSWLAFTKKKHFLIRFDS